jgi:hypothetical protein
MQSVYHGMSNPGETALQNGDAIRNTCPISRMARTDAVAKAAPAEADGQTSLPFPELPPNPVYAGSVAAGGNGKQLLEGQQNLTIMTLRKISDQAWGKGPEQVVRSRHAAKQEKQPSGLGVRKFADAVQQDGLLVEASLPVTLNEISMTHRSADDDNPILHSWQVAAPHGVQRCVQGGHVGGDGDVPSTPASKFPVIHRDVASLLQNASSEIVSRAGAGGRGEDVYVIQVSDDNFTWLEVFLYLAQGPVDRKTKEGGHHRIALLSTLPLNNVVLRPPIVAPKEMRLTPVPRPDIRDQISEIGVGSQSAKNRSSRDMIKSPHPVDACDRSVRVVVRQNTQHVHQGVRTGPIAQSKIEGGNSIPELPLVLSGQSLAHEPSESISRRYASHFSATLLQSGQQGQTHRGGDILRQLALGNVLSSTLKQSKSAVILEAQLEVFKTNPA